MSNCPPISYLWLVFRETLPKLKKKLVKLASTKACETEVHSKLVRVKVNQKLVAKEPT